MKITLKHTVRLKPEGEWKQPGETVDVPKAVADDLIERGAAEPFTTKPAESVQEESSGD